MVGFHPGMTRAHVVIRHTSWIMKGVNSAMATTEPELATAERPEYGESSGSLCSIPSRFRGALVARRKTSKLRFLLLSQNPTPSPPQKSRAAPPEPCRRLGETWPVFGAVTDSSAPTTAHLHAPAPQRHGAMRLYMTQSSRWTLQG